MTIGICSRKRIIPVCCYYGLVILTAALCFIHGVPDWVIIMFFIFSKVAWLFNIAASLGCSPCALPDRDA